ALNTWREQSNRLTADALWQRRIPVDVFGTAAWGLPVEDEIVALLAHAGKPFHVFNRLIWSVDIAVVVAAANRPPDWDEVARMASDLGCRTVVAVGLTQARRLGASVPDELCRVGATGPKQSALADVRSEDWPLVERDEGVFTRLRYALADDWRARARLFAGTVVGTGSRTRGADIPVGWRGVGGPSRAGRRARAHVVGLIGDRHAGTV
ncbi:MAG: nucleotidyltransferase family protein, partial [Acidimicrobiales bacterium]